jgi:hypothetical protein
MFNWSVDVQYFKQNSPQKYEQWRLIQLINYGLDGEKLSVKKLNKHWPEIKDKIISKDIKNYLEFILWPERQS